MMILCPSCHTELPASSRFCMNCGMPISADPRADHAHHTHPVAPVPAPLAEKVRAAAALSGERRTVTAVYVDVVTSSAILAAIGEQAFNNLLDAMLELVYPIIYHYEGTIAHIQDDELLVFFGAPVAHEDDPVRAVRTALELLQAARRFAAEASTQSLLAAHGLEFAVRISLSTGPVSIGTIGADLKYAYSALGGTVNLAAQLEAVKVPMSVLISKDTYRFIAPFFDCTDLGEVSVLGMPEPVHIYRVDQDRPGTGGIDPGGARAGEDPPGERMEESRICPHRVPAHPLGRGALPLVRSGAAVPPDHLAGVLPAEPAAHGF